MADAAFWEGWEGPGPVVLELKGLDIGFRFFSLRSRKIGKCGCGKSASHAGRCWAREGKHARVLALLDSGMTNVQIALAAGCSERTVYNVKAKFQGESYA